MTWTDLPDSEVHILETAAQTHGTLHSQAAPAYDRTPLTQRFVWDTFLAFLSLGATGHG